MKFNTSKALFFGTAIALSASFTSIATAQPETLASQQVAENISVISAAGVKIHTFHGVSNSHIIETKNELRLVDAQFMISHANGLKAYIDRLGKPLVQVMLSHNHPDHWFGAEVFAPSTPVAAIPSVRSDIETGGMRYITIVKNNPDMKDDTPNEVIVPSQEIALGVLNWDGLEVVIEEYTGHEAHHSMLIKIPSMGVMIGQDLFYNNMFLVASDRERATKWRALLAEFEADEARYYGTLLVGHGKNGNPSIIRQDIEYLDALEAVLAKNLTLEETQASLLAQFPGKGGQNFLGLSLNNLFAEH